MCWLIDAILEMAVLRLKISVKRSSLSSCMDFEANGRIIQIITDDLTLSSLFFKKLRINYNIASGF